MPSGRPAGAGKPVVGFPIGWCSLPTAAAITDAKTAGFEFAEVAMQELLVLSDADFAKRVEEIRAVGLPILTGYNPIPRDLPLVGPAANPEKQDEHIQRLIARASALKLTFLIFNSGASWRIPEDFSQKVAGAQLVDFSRRLATAAEAQGITVLVLPVRSADSNQVTSVASALKLVEIVNHAQFQLAVDYSFLRPERGDLTALQTAGPHLRHVHLANPTGRGFPLAATESDYAAFFRLLKTINYHGGISVHAGTKSFVDEGPRTVAFLQSQAAVLVSP